VDGERDGHLVVHVYHPFHADLVCNRHPVSDRYLHGDIHADRYFDVHLHRNRNWDVHPLVHSDLDEDGVFDLHPVADPFLHT
jgi:hypothetical protein